MSKPSRPSDPKDRSGASRTFFVTTGTAGGRSILQSDRMADLLVEVLRGLMRTGKMMVHEFVIMPNHVHILMTISGDTTLERVMQSIKGGFSFRAARELCFKGEIWQRGYSDVRIQDEQSMMEHRNYIAENPIKAGFALTAVEFTHSSVFLKLQKHAGAKARSV